MKKSVLFGLFSLWMAVCLLVSAWGSPAQAMQAGTISSINSKSDYVRSRIFI